MDLISLAVEAIVDVDDIDALSEALFLLDSLDILIGCGVVRSRYRSSMGERCVGKFYDVLELFVVSFRYVKKCGGLMTVNDTE